MDTKHSKTEVQEFILRAIEKKDLRNIWGGLKIYKDRFGTDDFIVSCEEVLCAGQVKISLLCFGCSDETITKFLSEQYYLNIEIVKLLPQDTYEDIEEYIKTTDSKYICFLEEGQKYAPNKISDMVCFMENNIDIDMAVCQRNWIDASDTIIAHEDYAYKEILKDTLYEGKKFLEYCINENMNLYGNLSTFIVSSLCARRTLWKVLGERKNKVDYMKLLHQFLLNGNLRILDKVLVLTFVENYSDDKENKIAYEEYKGILQQSQTFLAENKAAKQEKVLVNKKITFFYTDKGEYYNLEPIAAEAEKRGYEVEFTQNLTQKAEIGIYCQHFCYPENAKFSVVLLHDLAQGHNRWPNIWEVERWNKFDLGIVPGKSWAELWSQCACQYYVNPRYGTYEFGYPKSDLVYSSYLEEYTNTLREKLNFKYDFSVLYAPSWENDEKEDDFVRACASLKVNLLIKQAHWSDSYADIIKNIEKMRQLHEGKYENVYYIEPEESIMTALKLCDMVVSDESSVMAEALMFGKPSIAVTDWRIPDTNPSRLASVPMDYPVKCKKVELREQVERMAFDKKYYRQTVKEGENIFSNQGNCCKDIMDAIQYYTKEAEKAEFMNKKLTSKYIPCSMWN